MKVPFTRQTLLDWGGAQALRDAQNLIDNGQILEANYKHPHIHGKMLLNNREFETSCEILPDNSIDNLCPCYTNKARGLICPHVLALGLSLVHRNTDPERENKYQEEKKRAERLENITEDSYIQRVKSSVPGAVSAKVVIGVDNDWPAGLERGKTPITCCIKCRNKKVPAEEVSRETAFTFSEKDEALMFVLEDIAEGPIPHHLQLRDADFINVIRLIKAKTIDRDDKTKITINETKLKTLLHIDLDRETGELILIAHTELPFMKPGDFPVYFVSGKEGLVYGANNIWPLENVLPTPYHSIYTEPVIIAREHVLQFFRRELRRSRLDERR
jgi:hypothetical protein